MQELRERYQAAGQGHVFTGWETMSPKNQKELLQSLDGLDFELLRHHQNLLSQQSTPKAPTFTPPKLFPAQPKTGLLEIANAARSKGNELLRAGKVGYVLVAGGQGSRLGFDGPKGKYPVGPLTNKSLFAWHAARLKAAANRHGRSAPWYIMTSATNDEETRAYFEENDYFGLAPSEVQFFQQAMLPALDTHGRMVMSGPGKLFQAPNGHGGTLEALKVSGLLDAAMGAGIETFSYFQVDNPLARPADPLFLGLHHLEGANMSSKVVAKSGPSEKVGVLGMTDGVLGCIEYSDLPSDLRDATDEEGQLVFRAGNIAVHALQASFVQELTAGGLNLPWHLARKSMQAMSEDGTIQSVDGIKFETFIFDALAKSPKSVTLEVERALEFSPVKNAEGSDSPATCKAHMTELFSGWAQAAKLNPLTVDSNGHRQIEVDPIFAEDEDEFLARMPREHVNQNGGLLFQ